MRVRPRLKRDVQMKCGHCGTVNADEAKFCNQCGNPLDQGSRPSESSGERRQAAVLFADLVGYTALSEKLGEEAVFALMNEVIAYCRSLPILVISGSRWNGIMSSFPTITMYSILG